MDEDDEEGPLRSEECAREVERLRDACGDERCPPVLLSLRQQHEMARQRARPAQHRSLRARPAQTQTSIGFGGVSLAHTLSSSPAFAAIQSVRPHVAAPHPL